MALKIRLRQQGRTNRQTYRLVVSDIRSKRDGKYLENLGWYNPFQEGENYLIRGERVSYWLEKGAQISPQAQILVSKGAPEVMKAYTAKYLAKKLKNAAKRRELKKAAK